MSVIVKNEHGTDVNLDAVNIGFFNCRELAVNQKNFAFVMVLAAYAWNVMDMLKTKLLLYREE